MAKPPDPDIISEYPPNQPNNPNLNTITTNATHPALTPDPGHEEDFLIPNNKFAFSPGQLNKLLNPKSLPAFYALGGLQGLEYGLQTDLKAGLSLDEDILSHSVSFSDINQQTSLAKKTPTTHLLPNSSQGPKTHFSDRTRTFSTNILPEPQRKTFPQILWTAYNDKILILLTIAAVVSLSLGIYEAASGQSQVDWIEGVAVCVAIFIVVAATAGNDWQKERQFAKLNRRKADRDIKAIRSGKPLLINISAITVGDILPIEPGDSLPADGILVSGHGIKCDESTATGESDHIKKRGGDEVWDCMDSTGVGMEMGTGEGGKDLDPFIISGSKVLEGIGTYIVTSVGRYSTHGRIMTSLQMESDPTPLQVKLGRLASWIGWLGTSAALLLFLVLFIRFSAQLPDNHGTPAEKGQEFMDILIVAVTVIVVAIPEGLPLAVTLALAFATTRMLKENNLVRLLRACETMGNATVICSDKTGTLTQNKMTAVMGFFGSQEHFTQVPEQHGDSGIADVLGRYPPDFKDLLAKSLVLNSTAFEEIQDTGTEFVGSKTEIALLRFARDYLGMVDVVQERANARIEAVFPFDSARKSMGVIFRVGDGYRLLVKGASEIMLDKSVRMVGTGTGEMRTEGISGDARRTISETFNAYARKSLRTIGIVYRDFNHWPPEKTEGGDFEAVFRDMTWIGAFGIHDPLRPEVCGAIEMCRLAGVKVKMVTGDNVNTATSIATSCGIKTPSGIVMEGPEFRKLTESDLQKIIPDLQVLARSSPDDKRRLVTQLKGLGEIVAVTGDGTNDGPALKSADVGFSMGISGTEVAREASSIILLDDNFKSIVTAIAWGRCVNDAVAKFLQFQITVNITAVLLTLVTAIYSNSNQSVLKAVQLLWVNLIMDTFAALALATDPPPPQILHRPPTPRTAPLFTLTMWKMILGQSIYKLTVCFTLYFAGNSILNYDPNDPQKQLELNTIIFNTFVWMQIFNELNCRRLDNKFNVFEGVLSNYWFLGINVLMVAGQVLIVFVGGDAFSVKRLDGGQWALCLGCAVFCVPWAAVLKVVPDEWLGVFFGWWGWALGCVWGPVGGVLGRRWRGFRGLLVRGFRGSGSRSGDEESGNGESAKE